MDEENIEKTQLGIFPSTKLGFGVVLLSLLCLIVTFVFRIDEILLLFAISAALACIIFSQKISFSGSILAGNHACTKCGKRHHDLISTEVNVTTGPISDWDRTKQYVVCWYSVAYTLRCVACERKHLYARSFKDEAGKYKSEK
jgi:hypothetical protein